MTSPDTIVALSSGPPPSGVAVIRLSGPATAKVLVGMLGHLPPARRLTLADIRIGGELLDAGLVAWFPGPASFTGEDCAELHLHGSPAVVRRALSILAKLSGVRLAGAGEFTRRAFENGKLDLTEVEGLGDLIAAETEGQRRQAMARLRGELSRCAAAWRETLLDLRAEIEAQIDFSDEGDVGALPVTFGDRIAALRQEIGALAARADEGRIVREGARVAIAGPPNAGKSSLLNALARSDVAIVTDEPGTTRDVREVAIDLGGRLVTLVDMAGLRDATSKAEAEGVRRARDEIAAADLVLWLVAPDQPMLAPDGDAARTWRIGSKADLGLVDAELSVSVMTGSGLDELLARLTAFVHELGTAEPPVVSRLRDQLALADAAAALDFAIPGLESELVAENLRSASAALERLTGRIDAEAVLDRLFLGFCIGK